ncbi:MAG TPA: aminopeptidase, partial [Lachnospiraceae bacterium]|nr:aminopeptidase [Lachnospiraceae bacterium]
MEKKSVWSSYDAAELEKLNQVNESYKECLDAGKTERECVRLGIQMAKKAGYTDLKDAVAEGRALKAGDKVYAVYNEKELLLFQIGTEPIEKGMNILGAHVDSPRIDVKQQPLYEEEGFAYLDTHYYGGIKKYQWLTLPLALHGVIVKKDGTVVDVCIGEKAEDPVFMITDILVHLAGEQMEKKAAKVIEGEKLDLLIANMPLAGEEKDAVKANVLKLLAERYDVEEDDFVSAELEIVPAGKARDCGLDRSMIAGYGHDDRICAFTSLFAMLEEENVTRTSCCILVDKEEIGSVGASGMTSRFFENSVAELMELAGESGDLKLRRALANSKMLSSDVSACYDPMFGSCFEKKNAAYFGRGLVFNKYTGSRGKNGTSDANAEYVAQIRRIMEEGGVAYQTAELGAVDVGGGGTIAYIMANYGM